MVALQITSSQRVFTAGRTGSGKTYFERYVLAGIQRLVALDPKGTLGRMAPEWNLEDWSDRGRRKLLAGEPVRLRVPPPPVDVGDDPRYWDTYIRDVYRAGNCILYLDEIYGVVPPGSKPPPSLTACYTRGRELGIGVHGCTQRPAWVPLFAMSEADWFFVFRLTLDEDRRRLASFMGASVMEPIKDRHGFLSYHVEWDEPIYTPQLIVRKARAPKGQVRP